MTRAYLKLYFLLILPILVITLLPQNPLNLLTNWWISQQAHHEYGAIYPLMKEALEPIPQAQWQQHVKKIGNHFAYTLELKKRAESKLEPPALEQLDEEGHLLIKHHGNRTLLYPLPPSDFILYFSLEGRDDAIDEFEKNTRGFRYFLNEKIKNKSDVVKEFNRIKTFFNQELSIKKWQNFKGDKELIHNLQKKHVFNRRVGGSYYSYILSEGGQYVVTVKEGNQSKKFALYYRSLTNIIPALLLAIGMLIWLYLFRKELNIVKKAAKQLGQGDFSTRTSLSKSSTLYPVADSFNDMAERIQGLIEGHRDLTNAVSHELKTPLSRLHFALEMQKESETKDERDQYTKQIESNINALENLVDELLSYTRMQRQQQINLQTHPLKQWLEQEISQFAEYHPNIEIIQEINGQKEIVFDHHLLSRALNNLLGNATQYCDKKIPIIKISAKQMGEQMTISIEDNGIGINKKDCEKVFQPFTQLDKSRTRQDNQLGGYGMGLAIVKSIMLQHRGDVCCEKSVLGGVRIIMSWDVALGTCTE